MASNTHNIDKKTSEEAMQADPRVVDFLRLADAAIEHHKSMKRKIDAMRILGSVSPVVQAIIDDMDRQIHAKGEELEQILLARIGGLSVGKALEQYITLRVKEKLDANNGA
ncbi:unnamed protein product [Zymoseptoria tritici ST99CH_1E4]|uniref:Uncharacterized protein n=1 Tax=Zymoseptoria tritici ST99CH_1E4 TaxID=1276532 RepID=A0A2H1FZR0_ZYMTR|nr:unnamed protein product [Zymoseptoria tritici ST99CH_1E4]